MSPENPYAPPSDREQRSPDSTGLGAARGVARTVGTVILVAGLGVVGYGAVAFWCVPWLPPNGGPTGRLPSLYVVFAGIAASVVGLIVRDVRWAGPASSQAGSSRKGIPTSVGVLLLVAIVAGLIVAIALS